MASQHELTAKLKQMLTIGVAILTMTIFYGCDGGSSSPTVYSGMLIDSPVEGVEYSTPTQSGITDSQGTFKYQAGEMVTFYVGGVYLGESQGKDVISPVDLVDDATDVYHPVVTNIARFLQSLDEDGNPENGISISESTITSLQERDIDITDPELDFDNNVEIQNLMSETGKIPVSENDAQQNFLKFVGNNGECVDISGTWLTYKRDTLSDPWDEPQTTVIRQTGCDTSGDLVSTVVGNTIDWSFDKDCQTISGNGIITSSYSGIGTLTSSYMEGTYQEEGCHGYMIGYWKAEKDVIGE